MPDEQDVTVREGTIFTLEKSKEGFDALKETFKAVSDAFDRGDSLKGLTLISDHIIAPTNSLFGFFMTLANSYDVVFGEELLKSLLTKLKAIDAIIDTLEKETDDGNLVEVGDVLRFDYFDALTELENVIPELIEKFRTCPAKELDEY